MKMASNGVQRMLVDELELAPVLGVSVSFLRHDRYGKKRIPFAKIGGCVRYDLDRVREALRSFEVIGEPTTGTTRSRKGAV
jgi:hypothetical protein